MNEQEHQPQHPDHERLKITAARFEDRIAVGINEVRGTRQEIPEDTARMIAHSLGRAFGRASALAEFGRSGTGAYKALREEYLTLYAEETTPPEIREWIGYFAQFLLERDGIRARSAYDTHPHEPELDGILVATTIHIGEKSFTVHVPAHYKQAVIDELTETLAVLCLPEDEGLQAFLALPDINAMSGDIMEDFEAHHVGTYGSIEDALTEIAELDQRESEVTEHANNLCLYIDGITPDYEALCDEAAEGFTFVNRGGKTYVFYK